MSTVIVRDADIQDAERILEIYAFYVEHTAVTFEYDTPAFSEFQNRMDHTMKRYPYLVAEKEGKIQGYAYAGAFVGEFSIYTPVSVIQRRMMNISIRIAPSSMPIWVFQKLENFINAAINLAAGII